MKKLYCPMIIIILALVGCSKQTETVIDEPVISIEEKKVENLSFNMNIEDIILYENGGVVYFTPVTSLNEHQSEFMQEYNKWTDLYIKNELGAAKSRNVPTDRSMFPIVVLKDDYYIINSLSKYCDSMIITLSTESPLSQYSFFDHDGNNISCSTKAEADRFVKKYAKLEIDFNEVLKLYGEKITFDDNYLLQMKKERRIELTTSIDDVSSGDKYIIYADTDEEYLLLAKYFNRPRRVIGMYSCKSEFSERTVIVWYNKPKIDLIRAEISNMTEENINETSEQTEEID